MQFIDITGQKFGKLLVIKRMENRKGSNQTYWKCECDCGNFVVISKASLRSGNTKSCGCLHKEVLCKRTKDLTGMKYNRLTVLKRDIDKKGVWYICECDCGNIKSIRSNSFVGGHTKSCGCLHKDVASTFAIPDNGSAKNKLYYQYKKKADKKGYEFNLTFEEFISLTKQNCYYCDKQPQQVFKSKKSKYLYNGVDRKNNYLGYTKNNCVSCCSTCNYAKRTQQHDAFVVWIEKVYKHLNSNKFYEKKDFLGRNK